MQLRFLVLSLIAGGAAAAAGCARTEGIAHYAHDYVLDDSGGRNRTPDNFDGEPLRLVQVEQDGTTTIEAANTGERFSARPGDFFRRADGTGGPWGMSGLQLLASSQETGVACLRRRTARNVTVRR